jgi:hypothetical protein
VVVLQAVADIPAVAHAVDQAGGAQEAQVMRHRGLFADRVRGLDSSPYYADADADEIELENLARGICYRAVYGRLALERPEYVAENSAPDVVQSAAHRGLRDTVAVRQHRQQRLFIQDGDRRPRQVTARCGRVGRERADGAVRQ